MGYYTHFQRKFRPKAMSKCIFQKFSFPPLGYLSVIWSILMPLQYWDYLRKRAPRIHRLCGYTAFACSLLLSITGILFIPFDLSWSNPMFELHKVYGIPLIPSFNLSLVTVAFPATMITGFRALYLARKRRFAEHRRWTTYHGISGYLISLQRVNILITFLFGAILNASKELQATLGSYRIKTIPQKSDAERAAFALTTWGAMIIAAGWVYHVKRPTAIYSKVKAE